MNDRSDITVYFKQHHINRHGRPAEIMRKANQVAASILPPARNGDPATASDLLVALIEEQVMVKLSEAQPIPPHQFKSMTFPQIIQLAAAALEAHNSQLAKELRQRGAALLEAVS